MVGLAFTMPYIPAREDINQLSEFRKPDHPERVAITICTAGSVLVFDTRRDPRAASVGDILVTRLQQRGVSGVVTDGEFRDALEFAEL
jgi:regulator of RNase E activity RraA